MLPLRLSTADLENNFLEKKIKRLQKEIEAKKSQKDKKFRVVKNREVLDRLEKELASL